MNRYRAEILGTVPNGLTHNDVYASALSLLNEEATNVLVTKRRLSGNMISLIVTLDSDNVITARKTLSKVIYGISGFSADTFGFRQVK